MIRDQIKKLRHAADVLEATTDLIKRLRRAADALEGLQSDNPATEPEVARAIAHRVAKNLTPHPLKGKRFNGTHWKQRLVTPPAPPVAPIVDTRKRKYAPGQHWTQRPENKAKLQKQLRKAARTRKQTPSPSPTKES